MAQLNVTLPNITNEQLDSKEERKKIMGYLNQLSEQLRFVLNNLDEDNFTDDISMTLENAKKTPELIEQVIERIEEDGSKTKTAIKQNADAIILEAQRASTVEGNLQASITLTADSVTTKVGKNEIISMINQTAEQIQILASKIKLEGYTTINGGFVVGLDGNVTIQSEGSTHKTTIANGLITTSYMHVQAGNYDITIYPTSILLQNMSTGKQVYITPDSVNAPEIATSKINTGSSSGTPIHSGNINNYSVSHASYAEYASEAGYLRSFIGSSYGTYVSTNDNLIPTMSGMYVGSGGSPWAGVYASNGSIITSDIRKKIDIRILKDDPRYLNFAKMIVPSIYKMLNGTSGREHIGFIAQNIEQSMLVCGISDLEFAGLVKSPVYALKLKDEEGNELQEYDITSEIIDYSYALRYEEFVPLTFLYMQDNDRRLTELEGKCNEMVTLSHDSM